MASSAFLRRGRKKPDSTSYDQRKLAVQNQPRKKRVSRHWTADSSVIQSRVLLSVVLSRAIPALARSADGLEFGASGSEHFSVGSKARSTKPRVLLIITKDLAPHKKSGRHPSNGVFLRAELIG